MVLPAARCAAGVGLFAAPVALAALAVVAVDAALHLAAAGSPARAAADAARVGDSREPCCPSKAALAERRPWLHCAADLHLSSASMRLLAVISNTFLPLRRFLTFVSVLQYTLVAHLACDMLPHEGGMGIWGGAGTT